MFLRPSIQLLFIPFPDDGSELHEDGPRGNDDNCTKANPVGSVDDRDAHFSDEDLKVNSYIRQ